MGFVMEIFQLGLYAVSNLLLWAYGEELPDPSAQPFLYEMLKEIETLPADNFTAVPFSYSARVKVAHEDESLMRRMVKHSAATYCVDAMLRLWKCKYCRVLKQVDLIEVANDLLTGGKAYVAVDHSIKSIVVAFRGSANIRNWVTDFNMAMTDFDVGDGTKGVRAHKGFLQYATAIELKVIPAVRTLVAKYKDYKVIVTGHSLGGAVASLAILKLKRELDLPWTSIKLITFGEPRVGNVAFAKWMNSRNSTMLRVVNNRDKVPHVPPYVIGYAHHQREIFLTGTTITTCASPELEDATCSNSKVPWLLMWDHINYLDVNFAYVC